MKTQLIAQDRWCVMRTALCCLCAALLFGSVAWAQEKTAVEPTDQLAAVPGAPEDGPRQGGGSCATALEITYAQIAAGFHDVGVLDATDDCVGRPYHDVFYRYVCTHAGAYTFDMCGSAADTYLKIWTGGTCCTGSYSTSDDVCGNDPQITVALNAGTTYYFECGSYYSTETALAYNFNATITVAGACCAAGTCTITSPAACTGVYMGDSTTCSPSPCRACASMTPPNADLGVIGTVPWYSLSGNCADGKWDAQFIGLAGTIYHFDLCPDTPGSGTANFDIDIKICDAAGTILAGQDGSCVALSYRPNDFQWTCTVDGTYYVVFAPYSSYASHNCTGTAASTFTLNYYAELQLGACCYPNGHCVVTPPAGCPAPATFHPGANCGTVLPAEYHYEYPLDMPIDPFVPFENYQDGEESTPIGKIRIDLKLIGILGPLHIEVEHLGTTVVLWDYVCPSSDGMDVVFDDDGGTLNCYNLQGGVAVRPSSAGGGYLSDFRGMEYGGPWIIRIYSDQYVIIIVRWSLWVQFLDQTFICVPVPMGACCLQDGSCIHTTQADCTAQNGTSWQYAVPCSFAGCVPSTSACCWPNGRCTIETVMTCLQLGGVYYPGQTCGTVLPAEYHWEYPLNVSIDPLMPFENHQDGEESTPIGKIRIDLKLIGILGPLHIEVEHLGTTVVLWDNVCLSSDGMDVNFDDDGGTVDCLNLLGGVAVRPSSAGGGYLSDFRGMEYGGPWTIRIYSEQYVIIIVRWSLWVQFLDETYICVPIPKGACCLRDGTCIHTTRADCAARNGTRWQYAVPCSYANCQPMTGACCIGWDCSIQQGPEYCTNVLHGRYLGDNTTCDLLVRESYPGLPIPDNYPAGVSDTMDVQYNVTVTNVSVDVVINHTWIGDLIIKLTHGSTTVTLWNRVCSSNDNMNVVFDDAGTSLICATPTVGRITPTSAGGGLLSAFNGQSGRGPWTINVSDNAAADVGTLIQWSLHFGNTNPCAILDTVVCEPQDGAPENPSHPATYWYDVTPGDFGRCDFHVRVYDPNPANYTNPSLPAGWQFLVHQVGNEWWASWYNPGCTNAFFGPNPTRFQFTNPNAAVWGDWRTTIGMQADPYDVWNIDNSGHHTAEADGYGYHVHVPTFAENWYWKDCNGAAVADGYMPDFDQRQDFNGDGVQDTGYCGPTAVANSLWWFDCKFPDAGIVPAGWTPGQLIQYLAQRMDTNNQNPPSPHGHPGPFSGTYLDDMQAGIDLYLAAQGVNSLLYEHTMLRPSFDYINREVQKSQDVTLLVGFWHIIGVQQVAPDRWAVTWQRTGGHYLTVAGVDPLNNRVALSDPDGDFAEHGYSGVVRPAGTDHNHDGDNDPNTISSFRDAGYDHAVHNNDTYASHDYYTLAPSISPGGDWALVLDGNPLTYGELMHAYHEGENNGPFESGEVHTSDPNEYQLTLLWPQGQAVDPAVCQYYTEVEAAVVVSPFEACGPQPNALACKQVVCPVQTQQCLPKKIRHYLPQVVFPPHGTDLLAPTSGYFMIRTPAGDTLTYTIADGPPNMTVVNRQDPVTVGDHREIPTEMVQLDLVASGGGGGGGGGLAYVHLSTYHASTGRVVGSAYTGTDYPADSFFDVYVEIEIPDMGLTGLHNESPIPLEDLAIHAVPPMGTQFQTPSGWSGAELFTADGLPTGLYLVGVIHVLPFDWQVIECECMDANACHVQFGVPACTGGCPQGYVCAELGITSPDGSFEELWCNCLCVFMGDMDHNYVINGLDIQNFVTCYIENGPDCGCGDFNGNGTVDWVDLNEFVARLLTP